MAVCGFVWDVVVVTSGSVIGVHMYGVVSSDGCFSESLVVSMEMKVFLGVSLRLVV